MLPLFALSLAVLASLTSCAPSPSARGQDPFYLSPPDGRQQTSSPSSDVEPRRGGVMSGRSSGPGNERSNDGLPAGGSMSFGAGGGQ